MDVQTQGAVLEGAVPIRSRADGKRRTVTAYAGYLPALVVTVLAVALLWYYDVPLGTTALFGAYTVLVVALPGLLVWRALRGRAGLLAEDVAGGLAVGYALVIGTQLLAVAVGLPRLAAAPIGVPIVFAIVPRFRRFWRGSSRAAPLAWSWSVAAGLVFLLSWTAAIFYRTVGLSFPGNSSPYLDLPYQMALTGELKHHVPPVTPYVAGEDLRYHWFFHAATASASNLTGIEVQTLIYRLAVLPALLVFAVAIAVLGWKLAGRWWAGAGALALTLFAVRPFHLDGSGVVLTNFWNSPTQTFGAMIFAGLMLVLSDVLRGRHRRADWVLVVLLAVAVAGAKATFVPLLVCGLLLVAAVQLVTRRRITRPVLIAGLVAVAVLAGATLVLFAGSTTGLRVVPLTSLTGARVGTIAVGWLAAWAGLAGLAIARDRRTDPPVVLCVGLGLAGMAALLLTTQPGGSQAYFLQSARPYLSIAAVCGVTGLLTLRSRFWRVAGLVLAAVMALTFITVPHRYLGPARATLQEARHHPVRPGQVPAGALDAGKWLRQHSSPDDLVATNVHCVRLPTGVCDYRSFWVSAYAERRVLVEGWAYTPTAYRVAEETGANYTRLPFWDQQRLADNDAVFTTGTAAAVDRLVSAYGVRWLFADRRLDPRPLDGVATLRYSSGDCLIYEVPRG
ncbi:hypothetical protein HDA40_005902 [Hamadaea flava]|uniref:Uncharacterized protein n=1 Tax=Hamadaea flava TaxID=1742688 RepID=A0ABV8LUP1_9ACTN|nr:hypothetical protein [Hamadaea flava]